MPENRSTRCNLNDFTTGFIAGLAHFGHKSISVRNLDAKVIDAFRLWEPRAAELNLNVRFWLTLDKIHGESPAFRAAIREAVYIRNLGFFDDDHTLYFKIPQSSAYRYLETLPGNNKLWEDLAQDVINSSTRY
jgi:hypothetical protein